MGITALQYALGRYLGDNERFGTDMYEVCVGEAKARDALFGSRVHLSVPILVAFRTNVLSFAEIEREAYSRIEKSALRKIHAVRADWFILSDRGGIYLFEEIAKKDNARYRAMRNRFVVMNSGDGTVSFGPGHPENGQTTEKTRSLLQMQRALPEEIWLAETFKIFDSCRNILAAR
ncbi:MAG TPA: hypothetical protein PKO22_00305 [Treponemataceae bacterium]|nr:hypothetical protein [Treponemataceae bacterium]